LLNPHALPHRRPESQAKSIGLQSDIDGPVRQFPKSRCELFTFAAKSSQQAQSIVVKSSGENSRKHLESFASKHR
jgi:hypothetical protein